MDKKEIDYLRKHLEDPAHTLSAAAGNAFLDALESAQATIATLEARLREAEARGVPEMESAEPRVVGVRECAIRPDGSIESFELSLIDPPLPMSEFQKLWQRGKSFGCDSAPPPDRVEVTWIPVSERLPEDGQDVGFIVDCPHDDFMHGRIYGGRFHARDYAERWGGFSTHGLGTRASYWCPLPPVPDALRSQGGAG